MSNPQSGSSNENRVFSEQENLASLTNEAAIHPLTDFVLNAGAVQVGDAVEVTWNPVPNESHLTVTVDRLNLDAHVTDVVLVERGAMPPFYDWTAIPNTSYQYTIIISSGRNVISYQSTNTIQTGIGSKLVGIDQFFQKLDNGELERLAQVVKGIQVARLNALQVSDLGATHLENLNKQG